MIVNARTKLIFKLKRPVDGVVGEFYALAPVTQASRTTVLPRADHISCILGHDEIESIMYLWYEGNEQRDS